MKRFLYYFSVIIVALIMASCESGKKFNSHDFEGEYQMRTETYWMNENGEFEKQPRDMISTIPVYVENDHLYIRTNTFGMPNMGDYDKAEVEFTADPPYDPPTPPTNEGNEGGENGEGGGIENVTADVKAVIILQNGFVFVINDGKKLKSLPIQALDVKKDRILFKNSETFDVPLTDASGMLLATMRNHFEYGSAVLKDGTITWDIDLYGDAGVNTTGNDMNIHVKYHNTLVRK
ncbi:MAG: hypothetical protein IKP02_09745 [Paludibacteraceae bacterium]|nr:hypothetical protein [Paludibacteraceae bacterium]MBR4705855.1 hypothetical protein [Paludibacteraceae bacterium]